MNTAPDYAGGAAGSAAGRGGRGGRGRGGGRPLGGAARVGGGRPGRPLGGRGRGGRWAGRPGGAVTLGAASAAYNSPIWRVKKALITGITGQDGSYLAELLLEKGYEVHGLIRRSSSFTTGRIDHLYQDPHEHETRLFLHYADLTDPSSLFSHLHRIKPDEVYNLGAQSHVKVSFEVPEFTADSAGMGTLRLLEAIRSVDAPIRFYQAGSSEMFGSTPPPQSESTPFHPRSPYAIAKVFAHWMTIQYRDAYNMHASNGILFNHESPRRGGTFVTRKVTRGIASILGGKEKHLYLGNLEARRDWGYAKEYVEAMWRIVQQDSPDDYVIAHRRDPLGPGARRRRLRARRAGLAGACPHRRSLLPPDRGRRPAR